MAPFIFHNHECLFDFFEFKTPSFENDEYEVNCECGDVVLWCCEMYTVVIKG